MPTPESHAIDLDARYGRTRKSAGRTRLIAVLAGIAGLVTVVAWLAWGGLLSPPAQFEHRDLGYVIESDSVIDVRFEFSAPVDTPASCAVQALNSTFGIVGWKIVDLPASPDRTRTFSEPLLTTETAVTGLIYRCWLT